MEIIVLMKQVPSTETLVTIDDGGKSVVLDNAKFVMNPYEEFAVEEALKIKEKHGGSVTIVSLGAQKAQEAIRTGLAMGADKGILIDDEGKDLDGLATAKILAAAIKDLEYDLIIAGQRAVDDDNYFVGPGVAQILGIPHIPFVIKEETEDGKIECQSTIDGGTMVMKTSLPALFTTQKGLNEPRYASLPGIMKAKKKPIDKKTVSDLGLDEGELEPKTKILALRLPPERTGGKIIEGESANEKAKELVGLLKEEAKVL